MNCTSTVSKMNGIAGQAFFSTGSTLSTTDFLAAMMASNLHDQSPVSGLLRNHQSCICQMLQDGHHNLGGSCHLLTMVCSSWMTREWIALEQCSC